MRRHLVVRLLVLLLAAAAGGIWARQCPGCIDRTRVNTGCEWTGHGTLVADAHLAEELAIQYADAEFNRVYGYNAHGGLEGSARNACMSRLVAAIERDHGVTAADIAGARGRRNWIFDAVAALSFFPIYLLGATAFAAFLDRRFSADQRMVKSIAAVLVAVAGSFLGLQVGQLWLGVCEAVRVRNGHISVFRAASRTVWTHDYAWALFVAGVAVCWVVARRGRDARLEAFSRVGTMAAGAWLAAMFADVFVRTAGGFAFVAAALIGFLGIVSVADRTPDSAPSGVLLH